jgi:hypothetical protein
MHYRERPFFPPPMNMKIAAPAPASNARFGTAEPAICVLPENQLADVPLPAAAAGANGGAVAVRQPG